MAAYALVVGAGGAALGAVGGFIPGIAITYPLTRMTGVVINGLVVLLSAVTAPIVGLTARSRLPLVARLD